MTLALGLAFLIGASLALFGAGGSIVTMPILVYVLGLDAHRAAGTSLVVVGLVALVGAVAQWRVASVRVGLLFGVAGMLGTIPGVWLNHHMPPVLVLLGFALTLLAAAGRLGSATDPSDGVTRHEVAPGRAALLGVGVGAATGLFGVGGGFLIVPALRLFLDVPIRRAVATSLVVIAFNSFAALAGHLAYGGVEWRVGVELAMAALAGAVIILPLASRIRGPVVQQSFAGGLAVLGLVMLVATVREMVA